MKLCESCLLGCGGIISQFHMAREAISASGNLIIYAGSDQLPGIETPKNIFPKGNKRTHTCDVHILTLSWFCSVHS
jgi:hypothetical protein